MLSLAENGDIPPEANQVVGQEAIALARRALEIHTQLHGLEHGYVANDMSLLARALNYFNNVDDVEVLCLFEQSMTITARVEGRMSVNVAVGKHNLALVYRERAKRARAANDLDREMANLELALHHYREAARIYRLVNHVDKADKTAQCAVEAEEELRQCTIAKALAAARSAEAASALSAFESSLSSSSSSSAAAMSSCIIG